MNLRHRSPVSLLLHNALLLSPWPQSPGPGWLREKEGVIADMGHGPPPPPTPGEEVLDAGGAWLVPGLVDMQVNGAGGVLFSTVREEEEARHALRALASTGVTACLPTVFTHPAQQLHRALAVLGRVANHPQPDEANVLGLHLEGPFLNPQKAGCHPIAHLEPPGVARYEQFQELCGGAIRLLTLAPELPGAGAVIRQAAKDNVLVLAGHTLATPGQLAQAEQWGLMGVTHLFNAMTGPPAREGFNPGATEDFENTTAAGVLANPTLMATLIADGAHVHPTLLRHAAGALTGGGRLVLVSDAMPPLGATGQAAAQFDLAGETVRVVDGVCLNQNGVLAGSARSLWFGLCYFALAMARAAAPFPASFSDLKSLTPQQVATHLPLSLPGIKPPPPLTPGASADFFLAPGPGTPPSQVWRMGNRLLPA